MDIGVDISGQITQKNYTSVIGCKRSDGIQRAVCLRAQTKKSIIKKYKSQITRLVEKIHCILIYYCIKDLLEGVKEIKICKDINFRVRKRLLPLLFKNQREFNKIKIIARQSMERKSKGHNIAHRAHRRKKYVSLFIKRELIEKLLFEFKK